VKIHIGKQATLMFVAFFAVTTTACAATDDGFYLTKVFFEDSCFIDDSPPTTPQIVAAGAPAEELGPLAAIFLPKLVDLGTTLIAESLAARSKEYATSFTGQTSTTFVKESSPVLGCLIVARGSPVSKDAINSNAMPDLAAKLGIIGSPSFYLESWVHYVNPTGSAIALTPAYFSFLAPASERISRSERKDIVITVAVKTVGKPATELGYLLSFPNVPVGTVLSRELLLGLTTAAQEMPDSSTQGGAPPPPGSAATPNAGQVGGTTVNISVTVGETEDAGDIFLKFSQLVKDSKSELDPALTEILKQALGSN